MQFPAVPGAGLLSLYGLCLRIFCLLFKLYFKFCSQASLNAYCGRNSGIYGCYAEFLQRFTPQGVEGRRGDERCGEELCSSDLEMCRCTYMHYHRLFKGQELFWPHLWGNSVCHPSVGTKLSRNIETPLTSRLCRRVLRRGQKLRLSPPVRLLLWRSACGCATFCEPSSPQQTWADLVCWPDLPQGKRRCFQIVWALVKWGQVFRCCEHPATRPEFLKCHPRAQSFRP